MANNQVVFDGAANCQHGDTLYFIITKDDGTIRTGTTTEAYATANYAANYPVTMTEKGTASRVWAGAFPALAAGPYAVSVRKQAGGSAAETDNQVGFNERVEWDGTAFISQSGDSYARLGAPAGASVSADIAAVKAVLPAALGANGNIKADVRDLIGTAWLTPGTAGTPDVNVKLWNALAAVALPLVPTTAGRTLDVSAGGEAGMDWANVGSPTTTNNLSGTTVKTATDVEAKLPAALVGGRMDSSVGAMAANVLTASAIAADAIGASELAADAVAEIQSGLATAAALATVQSDTDDIQSRLPAALTAAGNLKADVEQWLAGTIPAPNVTGVPKVDLVDWLGSAPNALQSGRVDSYVGAMAAAVITATVIATDAIGAAELAADAVAEIQSGLATAAALAGVQSDTDDIQTRLPAALSAGGYMKSDVQTWLASVVNALQSGRVDSYLGATAAAVITATSIAADAIGASELAADAVAEIQSGLATAAAVAGVQADTDDIQGRLPAALVGGRMDSSVGAMAANVLTASAIAADAIGASEIAADAIAEIQAGLATAAAVALVQSDTDDIQGRLPATLSGGLMRSQVQGLDAGVLADAAFDAGAFDKLLKRDMSAVEATAALRSLCGAILKLTSRFDSNNGAGFADIYQTDGATKFSKQSITTNPAAVPIRALDVAEAP